jgi:osmotically-inducible protein OsmY
MIETMPRTATERPHSDLPGDGTPIGTRRDVRTVVRDGVLVLVGTAPDTRSWTLARDAALRSPAAVVADLTVLPCARARRDPERAMVVARAVQAAVLRSGLDVSVLVSCDGPVTTLWGCCATREGRRVATVAAWSVPGVGYVQNWIREDC